MSTERDQEDLSAPEEKPEKKGREKRNVRSSSQRGGGSLRYQEFKGKMAVKRS